MNPIDSSVRATGYAHPTKGNDMNQSRLDRIVAEHGEWLRGSGGKRADLAGADLSTLDLTVADLTRATLAGANLSHAKLAGTNLSYADLTDADLTGANLTGANLVGSIGVLYAQAAFGAREDRGRMLLAVYVGGSATYWDGQFTWDYDSLSENIRNGPVRYRESMGIALDCVTRMLENQRGDPMHDRREFLPVAADGEWGRVSNNYCQLCCFNHNSPECQRHYCAADAREDGVDVYFIRNPNYKGEPNASEL